MCFTNHGHSCPTTPTPQGLDTPHKRAIRLLSYAVTSSRPLLCTQNNQTIVIKTCQTRGISTHHAPPGAKTSTCPACMQDEQTKPGTRSRIPKPPLGAQGMDRNSDLADQRLDRPRRATQARWRVLCRRSGCGHGLVPVNQVNFLSQPGQLWANAWLQVSPLAWIGQVPSPARKHECHHPPEGTIYKEEQTTARRAPPLAARVLTAWVRCSAGPPA